MPTDKALNRWFWIWCGVVVGLHAIILNAPPVNLEFAFFEGAKTLFDPEYAAGADWYFAYHRPIRLVTPS